jgi:hypothetical protein
MSTSLTDLTPDTQAAVAQLLDHAQAGGYTVRIDSTLRTCDEQAAIYAQGRTAPGNIVTQVQGCGSYHVLGRAVDIYIGSEVCADYLELGEFWESMGGVWGGRFSFADCVHFEWHHPTLDLSALCPPGVACSDAVANQPSASSPTALALMGAAVGGVLGLVLARR